MSKHIVVIPGDGIGTEITDAAVEVLKKIDDIYKIGLTYEWKDAGGAATTNSVNRCRRIPLMPARRQTPSCSALSAVTSGITWSHRSVRKKPSSA